MNMVKILSKGQIVLPKYILDSLGVHEEDSLTIEASEGKIILKKIKTIHDSIGSLPKIGMTIDETPEKAERAGMKAHA